MMKKVVLIGCPVTGSERFLSKSNFKPGFSYEDFYGVIDAPGHIPTGETIHVYSGTSDQIWGQDNLASRDGNW